jgi:ATP-dependent RNA helicase DHX57
MHEPTNSGRCSYDSRVLRRGDTFSQPQIASANLVKNFLSLSSIQSVTSLRRDFFSYLTDLGFIPHHLKSSSEMLNGNSDNVNLVKSVILGGFWPQTARVRVRVGAQKFDQVQAGTVAREINARDYVLHDLKVGRVFLHPGSVLFDTTSWKCDFVTYFHKYQSDKVYLRDATQVGILSICGNGDVDQFNN